MAKVKKEQVKQGEQQVLVPIGTLHTMSAEQIVELVNRAYQQNSKTTLAEISKQFNCKNSALSAKLRENGYVFNRTKRKYEKQSKTTQITDKNIETFNFLLTADFSKAFSAKVNPEVLAEFIEEARKRYPTMPIGKALSLLIKRYTHQEW